MSCPSAAATVQPNARELRADVAQVDHVCGGAVDLQAVDVHDGDEVVEALVRREHRSLPHLALLQLAVSEQAEHGRVVRVEPQRCAFYPRVLSPCLAGFFFCLTRLKCALLNFSVLHSSPRLSQNKR